MWMTCGQFFCVFENYVTCKALAGALCIDSRPATTAWLTVGPAWHAVECQRAVCRGPCNSEAAAFKNVWKRTSQSQADGAAQTASGCVANGIAHVPRSTGNLLQAAFPSYMQSRVRHHQSMEEKSLRGFDTVDMAKTRAAAHLHCQVKAAPQSHTCHCHGPQSCSCLVRPGSAQASSPRRHLTS